MLMPNVNRGLSFRKIDNCVWSTWISFVLILKTYFKEYNGYFGVKMHKYLVVSNLNKNIYNLHGKAPHMNV